MLRRGGRGHRRDELWGFITGAVGRFAVVKVSPLKLSCINCWIICVRGFSSPAGELLDASHMSVSHLQISTLLLKFSCSEFCQFCEQEISEGFLHCLLLATSSWGFGGFFNCQKVQKCFISLETSKNHTFKIIICLFWWGFLLVFPKVGDFHCSCALSYFPFQRGEAGWSYLPRKLSEVQGTQLSYTTTEISLETFSKHHLAVRKAHTSAVFPFIFHCGISSENQGN